MLAGGLLGMIAATALLTVWGLWLYATAFNPNLVGWIYIATDLLIGAGLGLLRIQESISLERVLRLVGRGFLCYGLADTVWTVSFPDGSARLADTLHTTLFYAAAVILFARAGFTLFLYLRVLLGLSRVWLWMALGVGIGVGLTTFLTGAGDLTFWDMVAHLLNTAMAASGAFATALFVLTTIATGGGSLSRWLLPASLGFALIFVGDVLYSKLGETYSFGSVADWCYILGNSMFFLYFVKTWRLKFLGRLNLSQAP